ncbi:MAG TPA: NADP-dependent malic enzyme [Firmicutes bacterium]|jgi:malate dehydrogenase (oxaloacetate-decarboxylating)|nr:NADP-dependent malic enzyme [Bacillota bacterium]HHT43758.1 NADP-dependent malic enzyme [Bacillota bacterium]
MNVYERALEQHKQWRGKVEIVSRATVKNAAELSLAYSPGVAEPCRRIAADPEAVWELTWKGNTIAVVSDGTAVLGLGNIGPAAALPVMEGKAVLFREFGNVNAIPICLDTQDVDEIVNIVKALEPTIAGVNLEDIASPRCFEIEERLKAETNMFIFHDDQHGTAVVCLAGLINALKVVGKGKDAVIVVNGIGAAGGAIIRLLLHDGYTNIRACGRQGRLIPGDPENNAIQEEIAKATNPEGLKQNLAEAMTGADVFIGVSAANVVTPEMVKSMNDQPIIMALANPEPEIAVELALEAGAAIVATGRSDYPNQINNVLGFPGIFRGALDVRATDINDAMKIAAANAIASLVEEPTNECIIPSPFDPRVAAVVAEAVAETAKKTGVAREV